MDTTEALQAEVIQLKKELAIQKELTESYKESANNYYKNETLGI